MPLADDSGSFGLMPGSLLEPPVYGAKVLSLHPDNPSRGLPMIQGFVVLFDHSNGELKALIEGAEVTAIRTAAASGLATRELARRSSSTHGVFGTGVQAATHIDAIAAVRPIEKVLVWGRDYAKAQAFADQQAARTAADIIAVDDPEPAANCDVVSTATAAADPVLRGAWLQPGAHVNLVGAHTATTREADSDALARSSIYVDLLDSAMNEAGDVLIPIQEGRVSASDIVGEIGQLLLGDIKGRADDDQITLYKSVGVVAQDLFAAEYVLREAEARSKGLVVDLR